jgi:hypothetical protein
MSPSIWKTYVHTTLLPPPKMTKLLLSPIMQKWLIQHTECYLCSQGHLGNREVTSGGEFNWDINSIK